MGDSNRGTDVFDAIATKELQATKFGFATAPTAAQTGWSVTNLTPNRTCDCNAAVATIGDCLGQLITDLIAKGIISA